MDRQIHITISFKNNLLCAAIIPRTTSVFDDEIILKFPLEYVEFSGATYFRLLVSFLLFNYLDFI